MSNQYQQLTLNSESDVEQKLIYPLLTTASPVGLGYSESDISTKHSIRKISIDKGQKKKLYFPDYAVILDGLPVLIIEAKTPGEDLREAAREARLYATEINSSYHRNINPCSTLIVSDGNKTLGYYWDQDEPFVELTTADLDSANEGFSRLIAHTSHKALKLYASKLLVSIRGVAVYFKPIYMLGGKTVINEVVGDNSFGANVSIEYKYLFNPETAEDRASIVHNAYVSSRRKQAHVAPIDKLIRAALPRHIVDAREIADSSQPKEIIEEFGNLKRIRNEICLLVGSVGSGKSTFTDYLKLKALPKKLTGATEWVNLNLNKAPLSRGLIYQWVLDKIITSMAASHSNVDFSEISVLKKIYASELNKVEKGKAALYPKDSEKYTDIIFQEIDRLQRDKAATLRGMVNLILAGSEKLLVIVLDNCDKRNRDDQLLMFEVASWLKSEFQCMVFLPIRDTTYDQYRDEPPLDTVIKDLVFRIDPPLLERVIYERLNYALREIGLQNSKFIYHLPNGMKVECARAEVADYMKCMVASLFQDQLFKRIISGLAGRNIRKGLEILLDFCKSGHIGTDEILRIKTSNGEHKLPSHLIARILLKGKRKYYSDRESHIKNLFDSDENDSLPDPFVRISILQWLKEHKRIAGPNRIIGFHKVSALVGALQVLGHSVDRILKEVSTLSLAGCITTETQHSTISIEDLISLEPAGFIHLDLLRNINYLSTVSEDVLYRENQVAKAISENLIGSGRFKSNSRQSAISNAKLMIDYLVGYHKDFFVGSASVLSDENRLDLIKVSELYEYVNQVADNDEHFRNVNKLESTYLPGTQILAQVVSLQDYGFFVEFGLDGTGLIHKSQLSKINKSLDNFEPGDWVTVEVISYNSSHRKFDLNLIL